MTSRFTTSARFKLLARHNPGQARFSGYLLRKTTTQTVEVATASRTISFVCSTDAVDRDSDTIKQSGWKLNSFLRNPVILWAHDSGSFPIAKARNVRVAGGALRADFQFVPADIPLAGPVAECAYQLYTRGFLSAVSVGFLPTDWAEQPNAAGGFDFLRQELLEVSCVPIPSNPEALMDRPGDTSAQRAALAEARKDRLRWARLALARDELESDLRRP